jgi:S1-C subfamily serine protease
MNKLGWFSIGTLFGALLTGFATLAAFDVDVDVKWNVRTPAKRKAPATDVTQQFRDEAAATVRPIVDRDGDVACSAVVVRPGVVRTAAHCLPVIVTVDGLKPARMSLMYGTDAAIVEVPGIQCPCATEADAPVAVGEQVMAAGFPFYGQPQPSPQVITGPASVIERRTINSIYDICPATEPMCVMDFIMVEPAILDGGMSGGGAFVFRDGHWVLIGVNSVGFGPVGGRVGETHSGFAPIGAIR